MYERQKPFSLGLLATVSSFLNAFIFHVIWHGLIGLWISSFMISIWFSFIYFLLILAWFTLYMAPSILPNLLHLASSEQ